MSIKMELVPDGLIVEYPDSCGSTVHKIVDLDDFALTLAKQVKVDTGLLPHGTRFYRKSGKVEYLVLEVPFHIRDFFTKDDHSYIVPMPPTLHILRLDLSEGDVRTLSKSMCFSIKEPVTSLNSLLYTFPYGNVSGSGDVCWGGVRVPSFASLSQFQVVPELLFSSKFNGDLDFGTFQSFTTPAPESKIITRGSQLAVHLHKVPQFPRHILTQSLTLAQAIGRM